MINLKKLKQQTQYQTNVMGIFLAFIIICIILTILSPHFLTAHNLLNVLLQVCINFTIAIGMSFIILQGGIDLSVGANVALTGLIIAILIKNVEMAVSLSIIIGLICASLIGLTNGFLVTFFNLPPFIATLGLMGISRGAAFTITGGNPIFTFPDSFREITGRIAGFPLITTLIMLFLFIIGSYVLKYTKYGRSLYAIGGNENCAHLSGISVKLVKTTAYMISGFCCGIAAVLLTSRLDSAVPTNADGAEMDAIAAVVIGGISMRGGEGKLTGTVIGVLIIGVIANGMNLLLVPQGAQRMIKGLIIVLAVIFDVIRRRNAKN